MFILSTDVLVTVFIVIGCIFGIFGLLVVVAIIVAGVWYSYSLAKV